MTPRPEEVDRLAKRLRVLYWRPATVVQWAHCGSKREWLRLARLVLRTYRPAPKGPKAAKKGKARR